MYDEVCDQYTDCEALFYQLICPQAKMTLCDGRAYAIYTLGEEVSKQITRCFDMGEYLEGMILDRMADQYLYSLYKLVLQEVKGKICAVLSEHQESAHTALLFQEPLIPFKNLDPTHQIEIVEKLEFLSYTEGYMLNPVKSGSFILNINEE